jgi:NADH-quinone oxidoreductase subunit J
VIASLAFYIFSFLLLGSAAMVIFARNTVHSVLYLILSFFNAAGVFILLQAEFIAMILVIVYVGAVAVLFLFVVMMLDLNPLQRSFFFLRNFANFTKNLFLVMSFIILYITLFLVVILGENYILNYYNIEVEGFWERLLLLIFTGVFVSFLIPYRVYRWLTKVVSDLRQNVSAAIMISAIMLIELVLIVTSFKSLIFKENFSTSPISSESKVTNTKALGAVLYTDYFYLLQIAGLILLVAMIGAIVLTYRRRPGIKRQDIATQLKRSTKNTIELRKISLRKGI